MGIPEFLYNDINRGAIQLISAAVSGGAVSMLVNRLDKEPLDIAGPVTVFIVSLLIQIYLIKCANKKAEKSKELVEQLIKEKEMANCELKSKNDSLEQELDNRNWQLSSLEDRLEERNEDVQILIDQLETAESELISLGGVFFKNSEALNSIAEEIEKSGKYVEHTWNFQRVCDKLCESMLAVVKKAALCGENFSISYIALYSNLRGSMCSLPRSMAYMIGYADTHGERPTIYYPRIIPRSYYSRKVFKNRKHDVAFLGSKEEIQTNFFLKDKSQCKYEQYIGLPVFCGGDNMIGLIEIIALNNSKIVNQSISEAKKMVEIYLKPYAHLFLLMDKIERAMLAQPKNM